ncbi:phosphatase PAP2 family protein [Pedobacter antarcticus]|uniref:phosphatase PAP2 family protein n=1 Tax=Pedobacter antarcticus TaxID=34086 RepID=UPI001C594E7B|nr:phosphatase PAP2 family protein [Pedobacter antarcticus]
MKLSLILLSGLFFPGISMAQYTDSVSHHSKPKVVDFIPAAAAVGYGFIALNNNTLRKFDNYIHEQTNKRHPGFNTSADDYLRYLPALAVYGLDLAGVKGKHNFVDKSALLLISGTFTMGSVHLLKNSSNRMRPNGLNDYSFPSGHTAMAFASAEFLRQEYGDVSVWYTIGGYSVATATGVLRMYKNYHWFSDVVAGAGLGILSTKFAYVVYPSIRKWVTGKDQSNFVMMPVYQNRAAGFAFSGKF